MQIVDGYLLLSFSYDFANEIALDRLERIFGMKPVEAKLQLKRIAPEYIQYRTPPVWLQLGPRDVATRGRTLSFTVDAKLYDFGCASLRYWLPLRCPIEELKRHSYELVENEDLEKDAATLLDRLRGELQDAVVGPFRRPTTESYAVHYITRFDEPATAEILLDRHWRDIAAALCCEERPLSDQELRDSIKSALSYFPDDLVVVDWNAAFVYDAEASYEVLDIVEHAVVELLELRTYDAILDRTLDKAYDDLAPRGGFGLFSRHIPRVLAVLSSTRLEVIDVIEKVENALKLIGDLFLVKVHNAASAAFGLEQWKRSVDKKLSTVLDSYVMLSNRLDSRRMLWLEAMFVALFVIDIALLLLRIG